MSRDLLPYPPAAAEWLDIHAVFRAQSPESQAVSRAWFHLMISSVNCAYCGHRGTAGQARVGPVSPAQGQSLDRLADLAVDFVARELTPGSSTDWESVLAETSVS